MTDEQVGEAPDGDSSPVDPPRQRRAVQGRMMSSTRTGAAVEADQVQVQDDQPDDAVPTGTVALRRRRRRQRRLGWAMLLVAVLLIGAGAWVGVTAVDARDELTEVRAGLTTLQSQIGRRDFVAAEKTASQIAVHATNAHDLTTGPAWWASSKLPYVGDPLVTIRGVALAVDRLANEVLPDLIATGKNFDPSKLQLAGDQINVDALAALGNQIDPPLALTRRIRADVAALPTGTWLGTVDEARTDLLNALDGLLVTAGSAADALQVAPILLGAQTPQRFFVGFLNGAETRGLGGLPGAFAILVADKGTLTFEHFGSDDELLDLTADVDLGPDFSEQYADFLPTSQYLNSTVSPNFPYAAQIWAAMWKAKSGESVTGAIALDPTALSYLLSASGPATLADGTKVTAANVVKLTQSTAYTLFGDDQTLRKAFLLEIASAVEDRILSGSGSLSDLSAAGTKAVNDQRMLMWSVDPEVQKVLAAGSIGGVVPTGDVPYAGIAINNFAANKLDYYLTSTLTWKREGCGTTRSVTATLTFTNKAPASGLPTYVTGQVDGVPGNGDNLILLDYQATAGAELQSVSLNGAPTTTQPGAELGHPVFRQEIALPRGTTQTLVLRLVEPAGNGRPVVRPQPLVNPMSVSVTDAKCG